MGTGRKKMNVRHDFPLPIRQIENCWIPLSDSTRLAARIWLPVNAEEQPVPALLEYLPYRKSDGTAIRDALRHPYFAGFGYASVRVDMRGSGDSDGILYDEYLPQEQDDALEVIAWLAAQPWCDGNVGMFGKSWGGFNCLQVAARRPPALKAVIAIHFTDDRYADDVHYMGGCLLTSQALPWATVMLAHNASPPDPRIVGDRWRQMWRERLEKTPPFIEAWLRHQRRDAYWQHGSVCEDYAAIDIPVFAVGGWADAYVNAVPRLLAGLRGPRRGLIGPWAHTFPETGTPGPAIGFLQESLRWWDQWLKGRDTGVMDEPFLRVWLQEYVPPAPFYAERPGRWIGLDAWPSSRIEARRYHLNSNSAAFTLDPYPAPQQTLTYRGLQRHGLDSGDWGSYGVAGEFAGDQRAADGEALSFTAAPLSAPLALLGRPTLTVDLSVDQPLAQIAARLCAVAPDGASTLLSWGQLNLTHRHSHASPTPVTPGERMTVSWPLNLTGVRLPAGCRLRLALSPTYARHAWPSPRPVTLTLFSGSSRLDLPVWSAAPGDAPLTPFEPPEVAAPLAAETLREPARHQTLARDMIDGRTTFRLVKDEGRVRLGDNDMEMDSRSEEHFSIRDGDPLSATQTITQILSFRRDAWVVHINTESHLSSDATHFYVSNTVETFAGNEPFFNKTWTATIPRDLV
jgi:putative CocE/NonD family hydrolase